jgi:outer membrane autotransporter protein
VHGFTVTPDVIASAWHEFDANNTATISGFASLLPDFSTTDSAAGSFGEISAGVSAAAPTGTTAFVRGAYQFGANYHAASVNGGVRFSW